MLFTLILCIPCCYANHSKGIISRFFLIFVASNGANNLVIKLRCAFAIYIEPSFTNAFDDDTLSNLNSFATFDSSTVSSIQELHIKVESPIPWDQAPNSLYFKSF